MEDEPAGSRSGFLARIQRFTDMTLDRLGEASGGKDMDEKEMRMLGSVVLQALSLWEKALHGDLPLSLMKEGLGSAGKRGPQPRKGED